MAACVDSQGAVHYGICKPGAPSSRAYWTQHAAPADWIAIYIQQILRLNTYTHHTYASPGTFCIFQPFDVALALKYLPPTACLPSASRPIVRTDRAGEASLKMH
eukprot:6191119-Pleurochrysis_carterae.AAC.1